MSSYKGYLRNERIIAYNFVEHDLNQNCVGERAGNNNMIGVCTLHFEQISKRDAKAGSCIPDRLLTQMG